MTIAERLILKGWMKSWMKIWLEVWPDRMIEGRKIGEAISKKMVKLEVAEMLLIKRESLSSIARITELPLEKIKELRNNRINKFSKN